MSSFRYEAIEPNGSAVSGVIEAEDRKTALRLLGRRNLFPSNLATCSPTGPAAAPGAAGAAVADKTPRAPAPAGGRRIRRKDITALTRAMGALLGATIPIPQALEGLGQEEENPRLRQVVLGISEAVRKGGSLSSAMAEHPRLFSTLYVSMVQVGEEAGALPKVMADLADLMERDDEVRSEVMTAIAYPVFVLCFGIVTVTVLLTFVLPKLFAMLQETVTTLPLPTLILLNISGFMHRWWFLVLAGVAGVAGGLRWYIRSPKGAYAWDKARLRLPLMGAVFRAAALGRFARTLGTLVRSGVSLLPALKIVENTMGNRVLAEKIAQVAEETRGGDSLAAPLRKLGIFPRTVVQMIDVGEETGRLDDMLIKVADIEEKQMRERTKTLVSFLAPGLIVVVGAMVGFIVIAVVLPIIRMSRGIH